MQKAGKVVNIWAFKDDLADDQSIVRNKFNLKWRLRSGRQAEFPEIDRAEFFDVSVAKRKVKMDQDPLIDELERFVAKRP